MAGNCGGNRRQGEKLQRLYAKLLNTKEENLRQLKNCKENCKKIGDTNLASFTPRAERRTERKYSNLAYGESAPTESTNQQLDRNTQNKLVILKRAIIMQRMIVEISMRKE
jgi:hypothetical protein